MIGAVADDFTGATDVAVALRRAGLRTRLYFGTPGESDPLRDADAAVAALKTRTIAPAEAIAASLAAAEWLLASGADQIYFKYCSTFDSTSRGNIGPVADALRERLEMGPTLVVPASPEHLRTQYMGHLFVDRILLSDSHMRHHPLTPMTSPRVVDILSEQTPARVGLIPHETVRAGSAAIRAERERFAAAGAGYVVVDALDDADLDAIAAAAAGDRLVTGAAGLIGALGRGRTALGGASSVVAGRTAPTATGEGPAAVLAGSCSARTLEQVARMKAERPHYRLDALADPDAASLAAGALAWYDSLAPGEAPLIYSSSSPASLREVHRQLGTERSADILEGAAAAIARGLAERGVERLVVAGGETSGAVVTGLGVRAGAIGEEAAPGVPWIHVDGDTGRAISLLLKSGNFGDPELLLDASAAPRRRAPRGGRRHEETKA